MMTPLPALLLIVSIPDIIVVAVIGLLFFGGKKLGDVGKGLGDGIRNFKSAIKGDDDKEAEKQSEKKGEEKKSA
jgi:sec-independent protein translocase protein TatA